jgi:hypothetical protein
MTFPVSVNGEVPLPSVPVDDFPARVIMACLDELEHEGADIIERTRHSVTYRTPFFRLGWYSSWWITMLAPTGTFEVHPNAPGGGRATYRLSLLRNAIIGSLMTLVFLLLIQAWFALIWAGGWLVGAPYLFTVYRARQWTRRRVEDAMRVARPQLDQSQRR